MDVDVDDDVEEVEVVQAVPKVIETKSVLRQASTPRRVVDVLVDEVELLVEEVEVDFDVELEVELVETEEEVDREVEEVDTETLVLCEVLLVDIETL